MAPTDVAYGREETQTAISLVKEKLQRLPYNQYLDAFDSKVIRQTVEYLLRTLHRREKLIVDQKGLFINWHMKELMETCIDVVLQLDLVTEDDPQLVSMRLRLERGSA